MSTSLKRLLEQEAARTEIPPAPLDAVVAGGRARVRRWRVVVGVAAAAAAAVLAIAIPIGLSLGGSDDQPIERPENTGWRQLDGPWTDLRYIHFGAATVSRPPGWNVEVLTSTRDSALYTTPIRSGSTYRLYEVRPNGLVNLLGSDVIGTPFADPAGSYVAWQDKAAGEIVVYDTSRRSEVARQPVGGDAYVIAVDGDTVTYADAEQTYTWRPGHGDPEPIDRSLLNGGTVTDVEAELRLVSSLGGRGDSYVVDGDGRRVATLQGQVYGEFDPSGRYLALTRLSRTDMEVVDRVVRAVDATEDTELTGFDGDVVQMWWDPSGSLVLGTVENAGDGLVSPEDDLTFYRCDPATGGCELIEGAQTTVDEAPLPANFDTYLELVWSLS